ncbi:MAG: G5 domain-containing protein [Peptococcaceae bacterium]|nr:G5 domain-containing protein [Peptococcaceae bacterium]
MFDNKHQPLWGVWHIESLIGESFFGKIYRICRQEHGQSYYSAVKIIALPQDESEIQLLQNKGFDQKTIHEFYRTIAANISTEIALMQQISQPANSGENHIVGIMDHMIIDTGSERRPPHPTSNLPPPAPAPAFQILIRMELLLPLTTHIRTTPLSPLDIVQLGTHVCQALEVFHRHNIIHNDIEPGNIFVTRDGYKLGNFAIGRQIRRAASPTMAPEFFRGDPYGPNVDTYSLGLLMYSLLNQHRGPFLPAAPQPITPDDHSNALKRRVHGEPLPLLLGASPALNALVLKACAHDPADRFTGPTEMRQALAILAPPPSHEDPVLRQVKNTDWNASISANHIVPHRFDRAANPHTPDSVAQNDPQPHPQTDGMSLSDAPSANTSPNKTKFKETFRLSNIWRFDPRLYEKIKIPLIVSAISIVAVTLVLAAVFLVSGQTRYGISINGQTDMVLADKKEAQAVLVDLAAHYITLAGATDMTVTSVKYKEDVEVIKTKKPTSKVMDKQEALEALIDSGIIVIVEGYSEITEDIMFETETIMDDNAELNTIQIQQEGETGSKNVTYTYVLNNSAIVEKSLLAETITKEPVKEIVLAGTKPTTGKNLSHEEMARIFEEVGKAKNIPPEILKAIGWVESTWRQFDAEGNPRLGGGIYAGIMQVSTRGLDEDTLYKLKYDIKFNIEYGADILAAKWNAVPKIGNGDRTILENWYFALWAYNSLVTANNPNSNPGKTYQHKIINTMANPQYPAQPVTMTHYLGVSAGASQPPPGGSYPTPAPAHYSFELTGKTELAIDG